jgi:tetratricopeptide (TPR) repeat protein
MDAEKIYAPHSGDNSVKGRKRLMSGREFITFDSNVSTLTRIGIMRFQNQDFTSAEDCFSRALRELNPQSPEKKEDKLPCEETQAFKADIPSKAASSEILSSKHNSERSFQATSLRNSHECDEGVEKINEVIMFEEDATTVMVTTTLQYNIAQSYLSKRDYLTSITWFQLSLVACSDPITTFKALHNIGYCLYRIGNIERSL